MGKFGPGTTSDLNIKRKDWKATAGAIENKNRPESLYITISSWVKPKLSVVKAQSLATSNPEDVAISSMREFDSRVKSNLKKLGKCFNEMFDGSSVITSYDFSYGQAKVGKRQFFELEINIDTINNIDFDDNPTVTKSTGRVENYKFSDFLPSVTDAVNKILDLDAFGKGSSVDFAKVKGAK